MKRVVAECLSGHLGIYEAGGFDPNHKCVRCRKPGLKILRDEEGHKETPLKQAEHFVNRETDRRKAARKGTNVEVENHEE